MRTKSLFLLALIASSSAFADAPPKKEKSAIEVAQEASPRLGKSDRGIIVYKGVTTKGKAPVEIVVNPEMGTWRAEVFQAKDSAAPYFFAQGTIEQKKLSGTIEATMMSAISEGSVSGAVGDGKSGRIQGEFSANTSGGAAFSDSFVVNRQ